MPEILSVTAPRRTRKTQPLIVNDCIVQAKAELVSLGGAVLLAICMLLSAVFIMVLFSPMVTGVQEFIATILFLAVWAYFLDSITERLSLVGREIVFKAMLSRTRRLPVEELEGITLVHQGLNLEQGIETIEFRQYDKKADRVSLGPCWQRNKLEGFLHSVEGVLQGSQGVTSIR